MTERVLAIDPGAVTSGVAFLELYGEFEQHAAPDLVHYEDLKGGPEGLIEYLYEYALPVRADVVVVEGWENRNQYANAQGVQGIGIAKAWAYGQAIPLVEQRPTGRKAAVPDEVMKRLGMYFPGKALRDSREAIRHALWFGKKQGNIGLIKAGWPRD